MDRARNKPANPILPLDAFKVDLMRADLVVNPPDNCNEFFALYDRKLKSLLDKHAPLRSTTIRRRQSAPWFNSDCRRMKAKTRRLEKSIAQPVPTMRDSDGAISLRRSARCSRRRTPTTGAGRLTTAKTRKLSGVD